MAEYAQGMQQTTDRMSILNSTRLDKSKTYGKDQESIQSSTTSDPGYHMGNVLQTRSMAPSLIYKASFSIRKKYTN